MTRKQTIQRLNRIFEVLGNPIRLDLFLEILKEGCDCNFQGPESRLNKTCVKGLMKSLDMRQSTVSTYLKDLEQAGLIECQKIGRHLYCRPSKEALTLLKLFADSGLKQIRF